MIRSIVLSTALILTAVLAQPLAMSKAIRSTADLAEAAAERGYSHRLIVELEAPSLADWATSGSQDATGIHAASDAATSGRLNSSSPTALDYIAELQSEQRAFAAQLQRELPEAEVADYLDGAGVSHELTYQIVMNAIVVDPGMDASVADVEAELRTIPGVKNVYRDYRHEPDLYASIPLVNAPTAWDYSSIGGMDQAGEGVKIASLDWGLHHAAPMFSGEGYDYPPGFPKGDLENTNGKIIASRAYFAGWDPPAMGEDKSWPGDSGSSHGVHTGSTAGGNALTADYRGVDVELSGVAPRAYLMSYRVFYASVNGSAGLYSAEGIAALEDIVADGADAVNNSWGGGASSIGGLCDPLDIALVNTWKAGVFVAMSEGNYGPAVGTGDHPSPEYMNVAATTSGGLFDDSRLRVTAPEPVTDTLKDLAFNLAVGWGAQPVGEVLGPYEYVPAAVVSETNFTGCEPWEGTPFDGKVALISRGVCAFSDKAYYAELAGAEMAIIHNDAARGDALVNMSPGETAVSVTIPSLFIGYSNGMRLTDWYDEHGEEAKLELDTVALQVGSTPDMVAGFSSRGPAVGNRLKPDIAAPGVNILAQGYGWQEGEEAHLGYGQSSGTSMATPHVAGASALLRQAHPDWSNDWIKSALMTTAKYTDVWASTGVPAQPLDIGAGRLDLTHAADPGVILEPPSLSFGQVITGSERTITVTVTSVADEPEQYQLSSVYTAESFTDTMPVPGLGVNWRSITLEPGESKQIEVTWNTEFAKGLGDNQGYFLLTGETHQAHMPAWVRIAPPPLDFGVLIIDNDGSSIMTETLEATGLSITFTNYVGYYTETLENIRYPYEVWDADAHAGSDRLTIPDAAVLSQYEAVIYQTGDWYVSDRYTPGYTPPTIYDLGALTEYANGGGRVMVFGQDFASALGIPNYTAPFFYDFTLGAEFLQDSVSGGFVYTDTYQSIIGLSDTPFSDVKLDISARGDGAGNQAYVDEIKKPSHLPSMFKYAMPGPQEDGVVATGRRDEPTLEYPCKYFNGRSLYYTFGLEGVNSDTGFSTREDLLYQSLAWLLDEATVSITVTAQTTDTVMTYFEPVMESTFGEGPYTYRWDFGDGTPFTEAESTDSNIYGHRYEEPGVYTVRVEAMNELGTTVIGLAEVTIGEPSGPSELYLPLAAHNWQMEGAEPEPTAEPSPETSPEPTAETSPEPTPETSPEPSPEP